MTDHHVHNHPEAVETLIDRDKLMERISLANEGLRLEVLGLNSQLDAANTSAKDWQRANDAQVARNRIAQKRCARLDEAEAENAALKVQLGRVKNVVDPDAMKEGSIDTVNGFDQGYMLACIHVSRILSTVITPLAVVSISGGTDDHGKPIVWIPLPDGTNPNQIFSVLVFKEVTTK